MKSLGPVAVVTVMYQKYVILSAILLVCPHTSLPYSPPNMDPNFSQLQAPHTTIPYSSPHKDPNFRQLQAPHISLPYSHPHKADIENLAAIKGMLILESCGLCYLA